MNRSQRQSKGDVPGQQTQTVVQQAQAAVAARQAQQSVRGREAGDASIGLGSVRGGTAGKTLAESYFMVPAPEPEAKPPGAPARCASCQQHKATAEGLRRQLHKVNDDYAEVSLRLSQRNEEVARLRKSLRELRRALTEKLGPNWADAPVQGSTEAENERLRATIASLRQAMAARASGSSSSPSAGTPAAAHSDPAYEENQQLRTALHDLRASLHRDTLDSRDASAVREENELLKRSLVTISNNMPLLEAQEPEQASAPAAPASRSASSAAPPTVSASAPPAPAAAAAAAAASVPPAPMSGSLMLRRSVVDRSQHIDDLLNAKSPFE